MEEAKVCNDDSDRTPTPGPESGSSSAGSLCPPEGDLARRIVQQVEFYFSDFNLMKDAFLLKHIRRNKEGYVSLKLVASFRKVKSLCKDWNTVVDAIGLSQKLQVNEEQTKIRRLAPVPRFEDTPYAKTVIAFHLPDPDPGAVRRRFSEYGDVASVRVESTAPDAYTRRCLAFHRERRTASEVYAAVQFDTYEGAQRALEAAVPLVSDAYKSAAGPKKKAKPPRGVNEAGDAPAIRILRHPKGPDGTDGFRAAPKQ